MVMSTRRGGRQASESANTVPKHTLPSDTEGVEETLDDVLIAVEHEAAQAPTGDKLSKKPGAKVAGANKNVMNRVLQLPPMVMDNAGLAGINLNDYEVEGSESEGQKGEKDLKQAKKTRQIQIGKGSNKALPSKFYNKPLELDEYILPATKSFLLDHDMFGNGWLGVPHIANRKLNQTRSVEKYEPIDKTNIGQLLNRGGKRDNQEGQDGDHSSKLDKAKMIASEPDPDEKLLARSVLVSRNGRAVNRASSFAKKSNKSMLKWYQLPEMQMTPELEKDIQIIRQREHLDPKRFYKSTGDSKWKPKRFQVGTVIEGPHEFYSSRLNQKDRHGHFVQELLHDDQFKIYAKRKFSEVQEQQKANYKHFIPKKRSRKSANRIHRG